MDQESSSLNCVDSLEMKCICFHITFQLSKKFTVQHQFFLLLYICDIFSLYHLMLMDCCILSLFEPDIQRTSFKNKTKYCKNNKEKSEECQMNTGIDSEHILLLLSDLGAILCGKTKIGKVDWMQ